MSTEKDNGKISGEGIEKAGQFIDRILDKHRYKKMFVQTPLVPVEQFSSLLFLATEEEWTAEHVLFCGGMQTGSAIATATQQIVPAGMIIFSKTYRKNEDPPVMPELDFSRLPGAKKR